jgi:hypothetical protein
MKLLTKHIEGAEMLGEHNITRKCNLKLCKISQKWRFQRVSNSQNAGIFPYFRRTENFLSVFRFFSSKAHKFLFLF